MKKIFTLILAAFVSVAMWGGQTYYYSGEGNGTNWAKTAMTVSTDGFYEYYHVTSTTTHQFKIGTSADQWAYNYSFVTAGFHSTNVTQVGDYGSDNCYCWKGSAHYILVYYPNTAINTTNKPIICASTVLPVDEVTKFYVTGDASLLADAGSSSAGWNPAAIESKKDTLTLKGLKANTDYQLKVTVDGTWNTAKGYDDLTEKAAGLSKKGGDNNNIGFRLNTASDVKVVYTSSIYKLIGDFYVAPVAKRTIKFVPSEEWLEADAKFAAWTWGENIESQWTAFFTPVSEGNDTLQAEIVAAADSIDFVRFSSKVSTPTWEDKDHYVWGEMKSKLYADSAVWTVIGWTDGQWKTYEKPCSGYGLVIDGVYRAAKHNLSQTDWTEYYLRGVELTAGQKIQICNPCADSAKWVITKYAATSYEFGFEGEGANKKYVVNESGKYDFYIKFIYQNDEVFISKEGTYTTAVRDQCTDVMMQAFFNESYSDDAPGVSPTKDYKLGLGNTRWETLKPQAKEIGHYFDLVWLPPSSNGDGMGYHPKQYSNQNSNWGSRQDLEDLIDSLHSVGSKVIADIVINHCTGWTSWCDFPEMDFGEYGKFYPDASYICKNDEVNAEWNKSSAGSCWGTASGSYDDGENWDGARDWSHNDVYVQDMFKAYLKWMRNVMKYDGFRYDKGDGFNNWHHDNYNKNSGPYIAFMESYNGDDKIIEGIEGANRNLMALDFQTKWQAFNGIAGFDYSHCKGSGLLGRGYAKYAVTFIESHDWFLRGDNENEFGGRGKSLTDELKDRLLQANAFLLSMPGVPCVFYPHWKKYKNEIKAMIEARKLAGVHSESAVYDEEAEGGGYKCTLAGKYGWLRLQLGNKTSHESCGDDNYVLKASGPGYAMWVYRTAPIPTGVEEVGDQSAVRKGEKVLRNGQLFIKVGEQLYDVTGRLIK